MELSSNIKSLKFMRRKEDAAERRAAESAAQSALGAAGHWCLPSADAAATTCGAGLGVRVEYVQSEAGGARRTYAQPGAPDAQCTLKRPHGQ